MAIKMVREPSETPNINNIDDIIPMRYAYGGQNGFVIGKGTEISNTVSGLNFTVNSGRLVLQGVECDIDASGVTITIDNIATTRYYTIYLEVNLGLNTATIKDEYDTATYPTIDAGDDLTENTTGVARLPLYQFTATSGIISEVNKVVESVKYTANMTVDNSNKVNNLEIKRDENGVLKIGDVVIPQRYLISSNNIVLATNNHIAQDLVIGVSDNEHYELEVANVVNPTRRLTSQFVKINTGVLAEGVSSIRCAISISGTTLGYDYTSFNLYITRSSQNYLTGYCICFSADGTTIESDTLGLTILSIYKIIE